MRTRALLLLLALAGAYASGAPEGGPGAGLVIDSEVEVGGYRYPYHVLVPESVDRTAPTPLLLLLHGCGDSGDVVMSHSGMAQVAFDNRFLVAYPDHFSDHRFDYVEECWEFFDAENQTRGGTEPTALLAIVDRVEAVHGLAVDESRTFVAGFSGGAAMSVVLGATYPERFAAIGVHSGFRYQRVVCDASGDPQGCDEAVLLATQVEDDPALAPGAGRAAHEAAEGNARKVRVFALLGTTDVLIPSSNLGTLVAQWITTNELASDEDTVGVAPDRTRTFEPGGLAPPYDYTVSCYASKRLDGTYTDANLIEAWTVYGLNHVWSGTAESWGPPASEKMWRFFTGGERGCDVG